MLPVMFAARKLDGEDPQVVYWLRIAYGVVQGLCILAVVYTYYKASLVATLSNVVYVPPAPQVSFRWLTRHGERGRRVKRKENESSFALLLTRKYFGISHSFSFLSFLLRCSYRPSLVIYVNLN